MSKGQVLDFRLSEQESGKRLSNVLCIRFAPNRKLLDYLVRSRQHVRRNRQTDLLGRRETDPRGTSSIDLTVARATDYNLGCHG
jgi:hypothetical protein